MLHILYSEKKMSAQAISKQLKCSVGQVNYWLERYRIPKRTISEAVYTKWNPDGDPFCLKTPLSIDQSILYGIGIGLYWGEGTKKSHSVRLSNSDPKLIKVFTSFLVELFQVDPGRLRYGLQIFGDMNVEKTLRFWTKELHVPRSRFYKPIVTPHRGIGTYRQKSKHGVLTVYFNNRKLRDILCFSIENPSMSKPM